MQILNAVASFLSMFAQTEPRQAQLSSGLEWQFVEAFKNLDGNIELRYLDRKTITRSETLVRFQTVRFTRDDLDKVAFTRTFHEANCDTMAERYLSIDTYLDGQRLYRIRPTEDEALVKRDMGQTAIEKACSLKEKADVGDPFTDGEVRFSEKRF